MSLKYSEKVSYTLHNLHYYFLIKQEVQIFPLENNKRGFYVYPQKPQNAILPL